MKTQLILRFLTKYPVVINKNVGIAAVPIYTTSVTEQKKNTFFYHTIKKRLSTQVKLQQQRF